MRKHPGKALTNMVLSCVLCSIAVNWVALPNGFVVTGITGLSMAAAQFTGVNYALIYYGLALAILLCTALALGWREVSNILVLSLLSSGDKYGYEMIAELEARSDHTFTLKEGTLYPILHTLEKDGAVKSYEKEAPTGRMRKYYRITRKGLRLLDEKKEEWVEFTHTVNAILAGTSPALA